MKTQFETWWYAEGWAKQHDIKELCRTAWENGAFMERERFGLNETTEEEGPLVVHPVSFGYVTGPDDDLSHDLDDDLNESLGQACVLGDTNCESCS